MNVPGCGDSVSPEFGSVDLNLSIAQVHGQFWKDGNASFGATVLYIKML